MVSEGIYDDSYNAILEPHLREAQSHYRCIAKDSLSRRILHGNPFWTELEVCFTPDESPVNQTFLRSMDVAVEYLLGQRKSLLSEDSADLDVVLVEPFVGSCYDGR